MYQPDINDLRCEIYDIKKQNSEIKSENQLLKVKVRKLSNEVDKKSRQIANLLEPKKAETVRKLLSQHGVSLIMSLREENLKLRKQLTERENHIRKLHNELQVFKLYSEKAKLYALSDRFTEARTETLSEANSYITTSTHRTVRSRAKSVNSGLRNQSISPHNKQSPQNKASLSTAEPKSITDLEKSYLILLNNNLKTIKECGIKKANQSLHENASPSLHSTQSNSPNEIPHIEIQQLQSYFINVLSELDYLKEKVIELETEQAMKMVHSKELSNSKQKLSTEIQCINLNSTKNKEENLMSVKTESPGSCCNTESLNPIEVETESNMSLVEECSLSSSDMKTSQNTSTCPPRKSVGIQTTRYFCTPPVFTDENNCEMNKIIKSSLKCEDAIEVQYIN